MCESYTWLGTAPIWQACERAPVSKQLQGIAQVQVLVLLCKHGQLLVAGEQAGLLQLWVGAGQSCVQVRHVLLHSSKTRSCCPRTNTRQGCIPLTNQLLLVDNAAVMDLWQLGVKAASQSAGLMAVQAPARVNKCEVKGQQVSCARLALGARLTSAMLSHDRLALTWSIRPGISL